MLSKGFEIVSKPFSIEIHVYRRSDGKRLAACELVGFVGI
jgi:hypothetical protein